MILKQTGDKLTSNRGMFSNGWDRFAQNYYTYPVKSVKDCNWHKSWKKLLFLQKPFEPQIYNVFFLFLDSGRNWEISVQKFIKETRSLNENMNTCCRKKSQIPSVYNSLRTLLNWSKIKFKKLNWCRLTWLIDMFYLFSHSIRTFTFELVNNHCEFSFLYFIW